MKIALHRKGIIIWQLAFLLTSMSWLLAPALNHVLSPRNTLISQYETSGQSYALWFRGADVVASLLVLWIAWYGFRRRATRAVWLALMVAGLGMLLDPILTTTCLVDGNTCHEIVTSHFVLHASETIITATAFVFLSGQDAWKRKKMPSITIVAFQILYGLLFISQLAKEAHLETFTQNVYQCSLLIWLAWFCRDILFDAQPSQLQHIGIVRKLIAGWAFINGLFAIIASLSDINLLGHVKTLYFASNTAWLAQHGVIVGVVMLYLSRHILRGELRARQILLVIMGLEVLRYALVTPSLPLLSLYAFSFCLLFVTADNFQRGSIPLTWRVRLKDVTSLVLGLVVVVGVAFVILDRDSRVATITARTFDHYSDYVINDRKVHKTHRESVLLAHTLTAFIAVSLAAILWTLFRPSRILISGRYDPETTRAILERYSTSSEDYFKLWPADKQYFFGSGGFVAYKIVGAVAFALADPVAARSQRTLLLGDFVAWARKHRLRVCFLPVFESHLPLYSSLDSIQIGARALIDVPIFVQTTSRDKWWRWKQNQARKQGYVYSESHAPHDPEFIAKLRQVSDQWLQHGGHQERGFALGYFDEAYLQQCTIYYLCDESGTIVAFTNQLPSFGSHTATIDLLRYEAGSQGAMPYLLLQVIEALQAKGVKKFDLGFVPFATTKGPIVTIAKTLSAGRFSAKGLEQFKNKFDPVWEPTHLAYDGDLADLTLIALHLEKTMEIEADSTKE